MQNVVYVYCYFFKGVIISICRWLDLFRYRIPKDVIWYPRRMLNLCGDWAQRGWVSLGMLTQYGCMFVLGPWGDKRVCVRACVRVCVRGEWRRDP